MTSQVLQVLVVCVVDNVYGVIKIVFCQIRAKNGYFSFNQSYGQRKACFVGILRMLCS